MDEKDFELLLSLARTRNITKTADALYISQSALSKRIQAIEKNLGVSILVRSRQGVRFTPAGEEVLHHASIAAQAMENMRLSLKGIESDVCGTLYAGFSENFSQHTLPDILAKYSHTYPKVQLHVVTDLSPRLYQRFQDQMDLVVLRGDYSWNGEKHLLSEEKICLICSWEHKDIPLSQYPYIRHVTDSEQTSMMNRWIQEQGITLLPQNIALDSINSCVAMVNRGLGWSLIPEIALKKFDGFIQPCSFLNGEPLIRRTHVLLKKETAELPQVAAFLELLKAMTLSSQ